MANIYHHITRFLNAYRLTAVLLFFAVVFCVTFAAFAMGDKTTIYFYSSETTINNFKSLKMEFDRYLSRFGPYELQPFSDREAFEKHVKDKEKCLLLLSSWHYKNIQKEYSLKAALAGTRKGKKYQKRVLVGRDKTLRAGRIASASSVQHTSSYLKMMLKGRYKEDKTRILTVPKDIDALMSVGFGMSKLALTTRNALEELKMANPVLYQKMEILEEGEGSLLLILAIPEGFTRDARKMVTIIQDMATDPDGKEKLRMLGLDGWQTLNPSDRSRLESK